jgi:CDP-diacylglycerol---glycerol-3-phosphate 3-phosphatidyltransferase
LLDLLARKKVSRAVDPFARVVARVGLTPTAITLLGLAISIAGAVLIGFGRLTFGAAVLLFGAGLDVLDGVLARLTGAETRRGALLDSFTDRLGEVAMWSGLAFHLGRIPDATLVTLSIAAVCGSLLVPFLRAKAEKDGLEGRGGLMGRAERLLVFGFGVGLSGVGLPTLAPAIWILAVGTWLTVAQRFRRIWVQIEA